MSMDALEFLRERKRMCESFGTSCDGCPLHGHLCTSISSIANGDCERILVEVEKWSKKHPRKTRQSVFLEQYPEARIRDDGVLQILPCSISASHRNARGNCVNMRRECPDCRREFWTQEVD